MSKRVHYCDGDNSYDIIRLYDGEEYKPFAKVYNASKIENKLFFREWKPEFQNSLSLSPWPKDSYAIMFSGGFDSLSLALRHLEKGERVYLLSIGFSEERVSSSLTIQFLKSVYGKEVVIGPIKLFSDIYVDGESMTGLTQQPFTAFYASYMPDYVCHSIKAVECAYIMNDDAISYQNEIKAIYNNAMKCHFTEHEYPPMKFPLTKVTHEENLEYVAKIEKKYQIIFPAFSSEGLVCKKYIDGNDNILYTIRGGINSNKPNKMCNVSGYLILEKSPRKAFPRLKLKSNNRPLIESEKSEDKGC